MSVTVKEVAEATGLSEPTVSHILSGRGERYRQTTQVRVHEIARQLGYRPNAAARATRTGRFDAVGLMAGRNEIDSSLFSEIVRGILAELEPRNLNFLLSTIGPADFEGPLEKRVGPMMLRKMHIDGMIVNWSSEIGEESRRIVNSQPMPAVYVNTKFEDNCTYPDDFGGSYALTRHLIELGHRRITFLGFSQSTHFSVTERRNGYLAAMREVGLTPDLGDNVETAGRHLTSNRPAILDKWLALPDRPTAVVSYGGGESLPLATAAIARGMQLGSDLSIASFSIKPYTNTGLLLTTAVIPARELGAAAARMALERIEHPLETSCRAIVLKEELAIGKTTGPPKG